MINIIWKKISYLTYVGYRQIKWMSGDKSPFGATMKLTSKCTLKCGHCPWLDSKSPDLPTMRWKELIEEVHVLGVRHLVFEGGEPTLRVDLTELVEFAQSKDMIVTIATNCTRPLNDYSPDRFLVSVDGLEETHDSLRRKGTFKKLLENIETTNIEKTALVSLSKINFAQIEDILDRFDKIFDGFWFSFVYDYNDKEKIMLSAKEKQQAAQKILSLLHRYPIINKPSYLKNVSKKRVCRDWLLYTVTADGKIHPGCMVDTVDSCRCDDCELACHREFSDFLEPKYFLHHLLDFINKALK
jgi:MoaA/NifB/PqqE/SkfB family radical SAM enzyme